MENYKIKDGRLNITEINEDDALINLREQGL